MIVQCTTCGTKFDLSIRSVMTLAAKASAARRWGSQAELSSACPACAGRVSVAESALIAESARINGRKSKRKLTTTQARDMQTKSVKARKK
jgi:hypothetical protein